jgi:hypothetical protein
LTLTDFESFRGIRQSLCEALLSTLGKVDGTEDNVLSIATSVTSSLVDISQVIFNICCTIVLQAHDVYDGKVNAIALRNCTTALVETVNNYPSVAASDNVRDGVAEAFSAVLNKGRELPVDVLEDVTNALTTMSSAIHDNLASNEDAVSITTSNVRSVNRFIYL